MYLGFFICLFKFFSHEPTVVVANVKGPTVVQSFSIIPDAFAPTVEVRICQREHQTIQTCTE